MTKGGRNWTPRARRARRQAQPSPTRRLRHESLENRLLLRAVTAVSPYNGESEVDVGVPVLATFDFDVDPATLNASTFELRDQLGVVVPATVTYDAPSRTATLDPTSALLDTSDYYTVKVLGGPTGVKESGTGLLLDTADVTWSFTTEQPVFQESVVLSGLTQPTVIRFAPEPDGRIFVAEKGGVIKVFDGLDDSDGPDVFADLRTNVHNYWDRGLLGLALDPNFPASPYVYAHYTYNAPLDGGPFPAWPTFDGTNDDGPGTSGDGPPVSSRLSRLTVGPGNTWDGNELVLIHEWPSQYPSHAVGTVEFGPDGALYVSAGDGASFTFHDYGQNDGLLGSDALNDPLNEGGALRSLDLLTSPEDPTVDPVTLDGTIIRVDPATGDALPTNPLYDAYGANDDPNAEKVVAFGLRNPFRFTVRDNGEIWIGDVGWSVWEEINVVRDPLASQLTNFGWPAYEGVGKQGSYDNQNLPLVEDFYTDVAADPSLHAEPFFTYQHDQPISPGSGEPTGSSAVSGLAFYDGANYPAAFDGALFFSDFNRGRVWAMFRGLDGEPDPTTITTVVGPAEGPAGLYTDQDGDVYYVDLLGGTIRRIEYFQANRPPIAVAAADTTNGNAPLTVNFDGTGSSDPDVGDTFTYAWDLDGDGQFDDSTLAQPSFVYTANGPVDVQLQVTDNSGLFAVDTISIQVGIVPTVIIDTPLTTELIQVDQVINFSGRAYEDNVIDEGQRLPDSALNWTFNFYQAPESNPTDFNIRNQQFFNGVGSGQYVVPNWEFPVYLEVQLTATDSGQLQSTQAFNLDPEVVTLSFDTNPSGLALEFNGRQKTGPISQPVVVNSESTISVPSPQVVAGTTYQFVSWSDGGAESHTIVAGTQNESFTVDLVPIATDTTDPGTGTITAQGENIASGEGKANAFDNDVTTKWLDFANGNPATRASWIQYEYPNGERSTVSAYTITSANDDPERDPRDWSLLGSNDGVNFTVLDTRTNEFFTQRQQTRQFVFSNDTAYDVYRLDIASIADPTSENSDSVQLSEIEFLGVAEGLPVLPIVTVAASTATAMEGDPPVVGAFQFSRSGSTSGALDVDYTISGSASAGDFDETLTGTVTIPDGAASTTLLITPANDLLEEGDETVELTIVAKSNYVVGQQNQGVLTITDDDTPVEPFDTTDVGPANITAQGQNGTSEPKEDAFDNNINSKWLDFANANPTTRASWIQYEYVGAQYVVSRYTIASANDSPERDPRDWSLLGSNDGINYTVLDTRTGEDFPNRFETREFFVPNSGAYSIYRLDITSVADPASANSIQLAEIELFGVPAGVPGINFALDNTTIAENVAVGSLVGQLSATFAGQNLTYAMAAGFGGEDNGQFSISGNQLLTAAALDFEGQPTYSVRIRATDQSNQTHDKVFVITLTDVNDPPTSPGNAVVTPEEVPYTFSDTDFVFTDDDVGDALTQIQVTNLPAVGSLELSSTAVVQDQIIFVADLVAGNLKFVPLPDGDGVGYDSFEFKLHDGTTFSVASSTMVIDVTSANDAPVNSVPGAQQTDFDTPLAFSTATSNPISVSDVDVGNAAMKITLAVTNGTLTLGGTSGLTFTTGDGTDDASMVFTGAVADLVSALGGLTFTPTGGFVGAAVLNVLSDDQGNTGVGGSLTDSDDITINVQPPLADFGDAAAPYPTLLVDDGARHVLTGPKLGASRDGEADGQPTAAADGDGQDDDGVTFGTIKAGNGLAGINIDMQGSAVARVDAWVDFGGDGVWDAADQILDSVYVNPFLQTLNYAVPAGATVGQTMARVRISTDGGLGPTGQAPDGEVEDYLVTIVDDVVIDLAAGQNNNVVVRLNGANIEVNDADNGGATLHSIPLASAESLTINGGPLDDQVTIDYAIGGFFSLTGGIHFADPAGTDTLNMIGTGNSLATYQSAGGALGNASVAISESASQANISFAGVEPLGLSGLLTFNVEGILNVGADTLTVDAATPVDLPSLTLINGGTISSSSPVVLGPSESLLGSGTVDGVFAGSIGSLIRAGGSLSIGDPASPAGFLTRGHLETLDHTVTLLDSNQAVLGSLTTLGNGGTPGVVVAANGALVEGGNNVVGFGTLDTPDNINQLTKINGTVTGNNDTTETITLTGYITGVGTLENWTQAGTYSPGASPAIVQNGNSLYGENGMMILEIGGTTPGVAGHDQVQHTGTARLEGDLDVRLINGFTPGSDDAFVLMSASNGIIGTFDSVSLPPAPSGLEWKLFVESNEVRLESVLIPTLDGAVVINEGDTQRSGINTVTVNFNRVVDIDLAEGDAFQFVNNSSGAVVVDIPVIDHTSGKTVVDFTFAPGPSVNANGGLLDGDYQLNIDATRVTARSVGLDGNADGSSGDNHVFGALALDNFYRKYGDQNQNGVVDLLDFASFRQAFGKSSADPGFQEGLDHESDGVIGLLDFARFRQNFGT